MTDLAEAVDGSTVAAVPGIRSGQVAHLRDALRMGRTQSGLVLVALVMLVAFIGPVFAPYSPTRPVGTSYAGPSAQMLLGADYLGRDVLSRFLDGGRAILVLSSLATVVGVGTGALIGIFAASSRGVLDAVVMRGMDVILAFPALVLVLMFVSVVGPARWLLVVMVGISHTPQTARVIRSAALRLRDASFILYADSIGMSRSRLLLREMLPNVISPLAVEFGLRFTYSIGFMAILSYLGFGAQPPNPDWGVMIQENQSSLGISPWPVIAPVVAIACVTIGSNLITDGFARAVAGVNRTVAT